MNKKLWVAAFTLTGSIIGAGILGLPYVFSRIGLGVGLAYLLFLGLAMMLVYLYLGEVALSVKSNHQLPGYAEKFLGKKGKRLMIIVMLFAVHSSLLAYLLGIGKSLSVMFFGNYIYTIIFSILFWIFMSFLLKGGLKELKKAEPYGVLAIALIILITFFVFGSRIDISNLTFFDSSFMFLPIGVIIFAFLGFTTIPILKMELKGNEKLLRKAIIIGVAIPIVLYSLFVFTVVGFLGRGVAEIVTLTAGFGPLVNILGIFTMFTSYLVMSFSIFDMYKYDLKFKPRTSYLLSIMAPIILFLLVSILGVKSFISILGFGGVISGGCIGIMTVIMNYKAKKMRKNKPAHSLPINIPIIILISLMFVAAIVLQLFF